MAQYKTSAELKDIAKGKMIGKYGTCILALFVPLLVLGPIILSLSLIMIMVTSVISVINGSQPNGISLLIPSFVITILIGLFQQVFHAGSALLYLNIACNKRYSVSDMFFGFRWQFKKSFTIGATIFLINTILLLPYDIFCLLMEYDFQLKWIIGAMISYIIGTAITIPFNLMLSQSFYLLLDFPHYSAKQLLRLSVQIMKGHKKRLFYIQISFIPLSLLAMISIIGNLWLYPYMYMTEALFFLDLMKPQTDTSASPASVPDAQVSI